MTSIALAAGPAPSAASSVTTEPRRADNVVYLDHHAATPLLPRVAAAMRAALEHGWANPSSVHAAGRQARRLLEESREQIAQALGARPANVVLTSGGTEACNLGLLGQCGLFGQRGLGGHGRSGAKRVLTTSCEHPAVSSCLEHLARTQGIDVATLQLPRGRPPDTAEFDAALGQGVDLVALQWVNHETGTVLPLENYLERCNARGVPSFVDATQALGKLRFDFGRLGATAAAVASHKIGGPPGAGAVCLRRNVELASTSWGGSQERGRRAGSPDLVAVAGFAAACSAIEDRVATMGRIRRLRDELEANLLGRGAQVNGGDYLRVDTVSNVSIEGGRSDELVAAMDLAGVCVASGAACSSGVVRASAVVGAMYPDEPWRAASALRFSLGPETQRSDMQAAVGAFTRVVAPMAPYPAESCSQQRAAR